MELTDNQRQLLLAFMEESSAKGMDKVSFSDLAKKTGKSKSTIFAHFSSKEDLVDKLYAYGKSLTDKDNLKITFSGPARTVIDKAVDYWHRVYAQQPRCFFHRIVEMQKFTDKRALAISKSLDAMVYSQTFVVMEALSDTERLEIDELDLATETFASTILTYLNAELLDDHAEDMAWKEERFITRFCRQYEPHTKKQTDSRYVPE
jgi:AcrR family transcriptional regulator